MSQHNNITLAGRIEVKRTKKGVRFYAFNHTRGRRLHIGTLKGATYEKVSVILRQPEPSLALSQTELKAVQEESGKFIRFIVDGKTYAISTADFARHAERYYNPGYGPQWRVGLRHFDFSNTTAKRNSITDNPVTYQQSGLFK